MLDDVLKLNENKILELTKGEDVGVIGIRYEENFPLCYVNDNLTKMLGYKDSKEIVSLTNIIHKDDICRLKEEHKNTKIYEDTISNATYRMIKKDGSCIWVLARTNVFKTFDNKFMLFSAINKLDDFVSQFEELSYLDTFSQTAFENLPGGYYRCCTDEGYPFIYLSERFYQMTGWTKEEIQSKFNNEFINMLHPDDKVIAGQYQELIKEESSEVINTTFRIKVKNGYTWVSDACRLVKVEDDTFFQGSLTDITEFVNKRKEQEEALREQFIVFDSLARDFKNVYWVDLENEKARILKLDATYVDVPGKKDHREFLIDDVVKKWIDSIVYVDDRDKIRNTLTIKNVKEVFKTEDQLVGNYRSLVNGEIHYYQYKITKSATNNNIAVLGFQNIDDIIEEHQALDKIKREKETLHQKEVEEQLSIINALSYSFRNVFVANMSEGTARAIRLDNSYNVKAITDVKNLVFPFDKVIDRWVKENVHPDDKAKVKNTLNVRRMREIFATQDNYIGTYRNVENGEIHYYQFDCRRVGNSENVVVGFQVIDKIVEDQLEIQEREKALVEARLKEEQERVEVIGSLSTIYSTIYKANIVTHEYEILTSIPLMAQVVPTKGNFDNIKTIIIKTFIEPEFRDSMLNFLDIDTLSERLNSVNTVTIDYKAPTGQWIQARFIVKRRDESGKAVEALYVARDITEERNTKEQAEHDALTGILNRGSFDQILKSLESNKRNFALILMDVDNFKTVNDTYGHAIGDVVLKKVSKFLAEGFRSIDYVCRIGGDEFAVLMTNVTLDNQALIIDKISKINNELNNHEEDVPRVSLSVGVAFADIKNPSASLFKDADRAMYHVKKNGRNGCHIFNPEDSMLDADYREDLM